MEELKVYSVSDAYIEYLRKHNPNVYSNKVENRTHTRKYIGIVIELAGEYKALVQNEVVFIRKHREKIIANAQLLYKQKKVNDQTAGYVKSALDYSSLEQLCEAYKSDL